MEIENQGALDAVNEALADTLLDQTPAETPEGDEHTAPEGAESAETSDGEEGEVEGRERGPDGKFVKKEEPKPEEKPEEKPGEKKPEAKPEDKKPDLLNDPIPKDLKPATQERLREVIKTAKEAVAERDQIKGDFDYMIQGVQATGATPEQYGETLSWLRLFNSESTEDRTKALELVETVADRLATLLGKERTVGDPLAKHDDLRQAVANGQITTKYAQEMARVRNRDGFQNEIRTAATAEQQQQQQAEAATNQARTELNTLEATLKATDPQYDAKRAMLVPVLQPIFKTMPPTMWKAAFEQAYRNLPSQTPGAPRPSVPRDQPLRANKNPSGGGSKGAAGSALDAVNEALGQLSGS